MQLHLLPQVQLSPHWHADEHLQYCVGQPHSLLIFAGAGAAVRTLAAIKEAPNIPRTFFIFSPFVMIRLSNRIYC